MPQPPGKRNCLPARIEDYSPHWLDDACRSGQFAWSRLAATAASNTLSSTPLVLLPRESLGTWRSLAPATAVDTLGLRAQRVHEVLQAQGALFFDELAQDAHLLPSELETALQALVGAGPGGCRQFHRPAQPDLPSSQTHLAPQQARPPTAVQQYGPGRALGLLRTSSTDDGQRLEHIARALLLRYGVMCWRLLERESDVLPPWRELLRCYHRLEARGEIRGGRFIAGLAGEQFALPEAVSLLRQVRRQAGDGALVVISASDPLNLVGSLLPGAKVPGRERQPLAVPRWCASGGADRRAIQLPGRGFGRRTGNVAAKTLARMIFDSSIFIFRAAQPGYGRGLFQALSLTEPS